MYENYRKTLFLQYSNRQTQNSQIARICRYEAHRRQNTPGKAKLCLFRDFSGYFEPFGNFSYISYISHTNTMCGPPVENVYWHRSSVCVFRFRNSDLAAINLTANPLRQYH